MGSRGLSRIVGFLLLAVSASVAAPVGNEVVAIRLRSLDAVVSEWRTVAGAVGVPVPEGALTASIGAAVGNPALTGIDLSAPIECHVIFPAATDVGDSGRRDREAPTPVWVFGVADQGVAFLDALTQSFGQVSEKAGVKVFDSRRPDVPVIVETVCAAVIGRRIVVGPSADTVALVSGRDVLSPVSDTATVSIAVDVQALCPFLAAATDRMVSAAGAAGSTAAPDPAGAVKAEMDTALAFLKGIRSLDVGFRANARAIEIVTRLTPMPDSVLGTLIGNLRPPQAAYWQALPEECVIASAGNGADALSHLAGPYADMIDRIYANMNPEFRGMGDQVRQDMLAMRDLYAGDFAVGLLPGAAGAFPGLVEIFAVKDPAAARPLMMGMLDRYNTTYGKTMPGLSLIMNEPRTHEGVEITGFRYGLDINALSIAGQDMPPFMGWLTRMNGEMAFTESAFVFTMGPETVMNRMLDRLRMGEGAPLSRRPEFAQLFPALPASPVHLFTVNPMGLLQTFLKGMPGGDAAPAGATADDPGGVSGYTVREGEALFSVTRISLPAVVAIKNAGPAMAAAMMAPAMVGRSAPAPAAVPKPLPAPSCADHLRAIDAAKDIVAMEKGLAAGATVTREDLLPYLKGGQWVTCPDGGDYTINPVGEYPTCSKAAPTGE